jgi:hypothetical protein
MNHNFFTKEIKKENTVFLSVEESKKFTSESDLIIAGKKTKYKGVPKYDYERINLYPFIVKVDFSMNFKWTETEKRRLSVPRRFANKLIVRFTGLYEEITTKNKNSYKACSLSDNLVKRGVLKKQKGLVANCGDYYYIATDEEVIKYFTQKGFETILNSHDQKDRVSFTKSINSNEEADELYENIYEFDSNFNK